MRYFVVFALLFSAQNLLASNDTPVEENPYLRESEAPYDHHTVVDEWIKQCGKGVQSACEMLSGILSPY